MEPLKITLINTYNCLHIDYSVKYISNISILIKNDKLEGGTDKSWKKYEKVTDYSLICC